MKRSIVVGVAAAIVISIIFFWNVMGVDKDISLGVSMNISHILKKQPLLSLNVSRDYISFGPQIGYIDLLREKFLQGSISQV